MELTEAERIAATAADSNPFRDLFEDPHFEPVENPRKYRNRDGSRVVNLANVQIPLKAANAVIGGTIRLRWTGAKSKPTAEFSFKAGGLRALDDAAQVRLLEYRRWIASQYAAHQKGTVTVGASAASVPINATGWTDDEDDED